MKLFLNPLNVLNQQTTLKTQNFKQQSPIKNTIKAENEKLLLPSTTQYLAFLGGYSLNLNEVFTHLEDNEYPQDIQEMALETIESNQKTNKTLYDVHFEKYKGVLDCFSLEELKEKYPEFKNVISAFDVDATTESIVGKFQNNESEVFPKNEDLTLQLIKLYWGQGFSLTDLSNYVAKNSKDNKGLNLYYAMTKKLNIPLMTPRYANVLKKSNKEYNEQFSEQMSIKRREAREAKIQLAQGEAVIIPRGPLSEAHKQHISEGLKRHYLENPEKLYAMSERQKEFYEANPEKRKELSEAMLFAWNKTQEGKSIMKHLSKFIKKHHGTTPTSEELADVAKLNKQTQEAFGAFWKRNPWAKEKMSVAIKKGWAHQIQRAKQIEWAKNLRTIPGKQVVYNLMPTQMIEDIKTWAKENNIDAEGVIIGKAIAYKSSQTKEAETDMLMANIKKSAYIIDKHDKINPKEVNRNATCLIQALLRLEEKLKHDTQNLPESLKNDKIKRAVLIQMFNFTAEALDFPIEENRTYENCNKEFTTEELKVFYNNIVESALTMGCDDFGKFMDKMLDMSYEELITRPDF